MKKLVSVLLLLVLFGIGLKAELSNNPKDMVKKIFDFEQTYLCTIFPVKVGPHVYGVTAGHCCKEEGRYLVIILDEALRKYALVNILQVSTKSDICRTDWPTGMTASFNLGRDVLTGEIVRTLGFPKGEFRDRTGVFTGRFASGLGDHGGDKLACFDMPDIQGGASGSPILNSDGDVIGVLSASDRKDFAYGVLLTDIKLFLRSY